MTVLWIRTFQGNCGLKLTADRDLPRALSRKYDALANFSSADRTA